MTAGSRQPDHSSHSVTALRVPGLTASMPGQTLAPAPGGEGGARAARSGGVVGVAGAVAGEAPSAANGGGAPGRAGPGGAAPTDVVAQPEAVDWLKATENGNGGPPMARPRAAAGALFFDEEGRVLLVEPSYKPGWDIPGGFIEPGESPYAACVREVEEEIGIVPPIGPLLVVDWASDGRVGDMLLFVFDGGLLPTAWRDRIRLDMNEIINCAFTPLSEVGEVLPVLHARRVRAAAGLRGQHHGAGYLEHGYLVPAESPPTAGPVGPPASARSGAADSRPNGG
ncbi:NUDIX hydrolase [Parafrankia colletiae]|uniref:NUDIX hydrolase n=1 Tax=Parafrankia colletiae TaxID=573497 RepID=A0A1S1QFI4_9ACTN|nr:NUDIX hydrolase [Parafrankia colletiae]